MNKELVELLLKLLGNVAVIMIFIVLACLVTPKIAKWIEKKHSGVKDDPSSEGEDKSANAEEYEVKGIFEASREEDWDPNYKIYNTDIYGVDFKNGKKQKHKDG